MRYCQSSINADRNLVINPHHFISHLKVELYRCLCLDTTHQTGLIPSSSFGNCTRLNTAICFYKFINICRHASTQTLFPPPLIFFHQQNFNAHFVSCATVPPFLPFFPPSFPFSQSNQVPQLEVKSLAIPHPSFSLALLPPLPLSLQAFCNTFPSIVPPPLMLSLHWL